MYIYYFTDLFNHSVAYFSDTVIPSLIITPVIYLSEFVVPYHIIHFPNGYLKAFTLKTSYSFIIANQLELTERADVTIINNERKYIIFILFIFFLYILRFYMIFFYFISLE